MKSHISFLIYEGTKICSYCN